MLNVYGWQFEWTAFLEQEENVNIAIDSSINCSYNDSTEKNTITLHYFLGPPAPPPFLMFCQNINYKYFCKHILNLLRYLGIFKVMISEWNCNLKADAMTNECNKTSL